MDNKTIVKKAIEIFFDRYEWTPDQGHSIDAEEALELAREELKLGAMDDNKYFYLVDAIEKEVRGF